MVLGTDVAGPATAAVTETGDLAEEAIEQAGAGIGGLGAGIGAALAAIVNEVSQTLNAMDGRTVIDVDAADWINAVTDYYGGERFLHRPMRLRLSLLSLFGMGFLFLLVRRTKTMMGSRPLDDGSIIAYWRGEMKSMMEIVPSVNPNALNFGAMDFPNMNLPIINPDLGPVEDAVKDAIYEQQRRYEKAKQEWDTPHGTVFPWDPEAGKKGYLGTPGVYVVRPSTKKGKRVDVDYYGEKELEDLGMPDASF